jgi:tripartite-type tricarboxylate transporter receptor subunit TctC
MLILMRIFGIVALGARVAVGYSTKLSRRTFLHLASNPTLGVAALLVASQAAWAEVYPSRPITIVVPFTAGGPTDALVRTLSERMRASLGQPLIVENVTGAAGTIGVGRVVRAAPDGYTVSVGHWSTHAINGALYPLPFDLLKDLEPISLLTSYPMLLLTKNAVPAKNLAELTSWLKANQDKVSVGTIGVGSAAHVAAVYYGNLAGLKFEFVPYRGAAPALQDLIAGRIDVLFDHLPNALPQVREGKVKAYAVTANTRSPTAPDIPTVDEAGYPGLYINIWYGLWVPKGTPAEVKAKLNAAVVDALADPKVRQQLSELGQVIPPRDQQTPEALAAYQKAEIEKWWPIVKAANMKGE